MKYQHRALPLLAKQFPKDIFAILVYGPDAGHVSETVKTLVGGAVADPKDPFSCLLYTSPSPRDGLLSRMPSSA